MNEKFENLMYQAGLTAQGSWDNMDSYDREAITKFAELIVKECAEFYEKSADNWFGADSKFILNMYADRIKQHFGVK